VTKSARFVHQYEELPSTQDEARRLVEAGLASDGHVILAERQTAGRGRFGRPWVSPKGGFYATYICPKLDLPAIRFGMAALRALEKLGISTQLKWPNDLLIGDRKLGGILIEEVRGLYLAGIGVNLEITPLPSATSVSDHGQRIDELELHAYILEGLVRGLMHGVLDDYRTYCATLGTRVRIERSLSEPPIEGLAVGIDDEGHLLVEIDGKTETISGGECVHLRTPKPEQESEDH